MKRKERRERKKAERSSDVLSIRGYSTDQRISIESMNVNIRRLEHQKKETKMVGLSIQEAAIGRQITSAENRASLRCPIYDPNNLYWRRVDALIQQQTECVVMMNRYNNDMLIEGDKNGVETNEPKVSAFLNQPSPVKNTKRSFDDLVGGEDGNIIAFDINDEDNFDEDNVGNVDRLSDKADNNDNEYAVKKEKIKKATTNKRNKATTRSSASGVSKRTRTKNKSNKNQKKK